MILSLIIKMWFILNSSQNYNRGYEQHFQTIISGAMKTNCHVLWISAKIIKTIAQLVDKLIYLHRLMWHNNEVILQLWNVIFSFMVYVFTSLKQQGSSACLVTLVFLHEIIIYFFQCHNLIWTTINSVIIFQNKAFSEILFLSVYPQYIPLEGELIHKSC